MASCIARQFSQLSVSQPRSSAASRVGCAPSLSSRPFLRRPSGPAPGRQGLWVVGARVANVEIPNSKCIEYSLQYIYGIGPTLAKSVLEKAGVDGAVRTHALSEEQLQRIRDEVDGCLVEGDLRRMVALNIKRLKEIQCYRGRRHYMNLPVRGQRTKTNARTRKGKAKTVAGKKK